MSNHFLAPALLVVVAALGSCDDERTATPPEVPELTEARPLTTEGPSHRVFQLGVAAADAGQRPAGYLPPDARTAAADARSQFSSSPALVPHEVPASLASPTGVFYVHDDGLIAIHWSNLTEGIDFQSVPLAHPSAAVVVDAASACREAQQVEAVIPVSELAACYGAHTSDVTTRQQLVWVDGDQVLTIVNEPATLSIEELLAIASTVDAPL